MKKLQTKIAYILCIILFLTSVVACGSNGNKQNESQNSDSEIICESTSELENISESDEVIESESTSEIEKTSESESVSESEGSSESEKTSESEKVSESEKTSESETTSESQKPTETQKPSESQKPTESQKPSEPEATLPSSAPGWSKVPSFKGSNLSEEEMAVKIVECIISSSMNDFQKALEIHDWLVFNVDYDNTYSKYSAKNAFVDRTCVCQGYAEAFELLAEAAGLDATFVSGVATNSNGQTESHAWNQVRISGNWYNVDVTWDDPTYSGKPASDHSSNGYDYFLVSKAQLEKNHRAESYNEGEKTCSTNYDRVTVLNAAANTGRYGDVVVVTNISDANAGIKKYMDKNKSSMTLWIYDTSITVANSSNYIQNLVAQVQYMISTNTFYPSDSGVIKCPIGITPSSEWDAIPIVHNAEELLNVMNEKGDAGIKNFTVRYESSNGQPELPQPNKYGYSVSYSVYNNGNSWLIDINLQ